MRSMGFTSNALLVMLLGESAILCTMGELIGCGTAYLVLKFGLPAFNINTIPMLPRLIVYGTVLSAVMGIVCGIMPAFSTAHSSIVESLRKSGERWLRLAVDIGGMNVWTVNSQSFADVLRIQFAHCISQMTYRPAYMTGSMIHNRRGRFVPCDGAPERESLQALQRICVACLLGCPV
jgi:hypothetical protein